LTNVRWVGVPADTTIEENRNRVPSLPHVNEVATGPGRVTLEFVNETNSLAFFEYRIDGVTVGSTPHPVIDDDVIHPGVCVDGRTSPTCAVDPVEMSFAAAATVEVRLALGGERDWDFDWTLFEVGDGGCKRGGWKTFGFRNQGQCTRFVNTGIDSR
jgi:hypothetical protein